jgi:hypothetical protein
MRNDNQQSRMFVTRTEMEFPEREAVRSSVRY